jgi:membrane dipeptidase
MLLRWSELTCGRADRYDGREVEIVGWMAPAEHAERHDYFLLVPDVRCCLGCLPSDPDGCIEIFAAEPIPSLGRPVHLIGRFHRLVNDPTGWHYQMRDVRLVQAMPRALLDMLLTRRGLLAAGGTLALAACVETKPTESASPVAPAQASPDSTAAAKPMLEGIVTVDLHSHAGWVIRQSVAFGDVAAPMRDGGMTAICLAVVADSPVTRIMSDGRIKAERNPSPGELYAWSRRSFRRAMALVEQQRLAVITETASLQAAVQTGPGIVASEGADWLDTSIERLDEAYEQYHLRHLQLTHYRVNDLGDIQTESPVHDGLTDFGAEVIRACNRRGIVVDVAHGTYDLVKRAAAVTAKPLVLSHTSLNPHPAPRSREISPDHAQLIAETDGVIGVWPPAFRYRNKGELAAGMARLADLVGIDHVGLGSDMLGLTGPSSFNSYRELPELAAALAAKGFSRDDVGKILGGNYARVFAATVG